MRNRTTCRIAAALALIGYAGVSWGATITVTTTATGGTSQPRDDRSCTLIQAIENANADAAVHPGCAAGAGADIIDLSLTAVYTLDRAHNSDYGPTGLPVIKGDLTIRGNGSLVERRSSAEPFRLLAIAPGATVTIHDLGIDNGRLDAPLRGGGILNLQGDLILDGCRISSNAAEYRCGGIANLSGTTTLVDTLVAHNSAGKEGGGICNLVTLGDATLIVLRSTLEDNASDRDGGGLVNAGDERFGAWVYLRQSGIIDNRAAGVGGGILQETMSGATELRASVLVDASTIRGNRAGGPGGGGIAAFGSPDAPATSRVEIRASRILDNEGSFGGGVEAWQGVDLSITESTIADNRTPDGGGGGILVGEGSRLILQRSTLSGNRSGAAISSTPDRGHDPAGSGGAVAVVDSDASITLSTFSGNNAAEGDGGAIWVSSSPARGGQNASVSLIGCTIVDNRARGSGGAVAAGRPGGEASVSVSLQGTIVAANTDAGGERDCVIAVPATLVSLGDNLGDDDSCGLQSANDLIVDDVMLWPLGDNGGPTLTHLPMDGSPAVDTVMTGSHGSCIDQRGYPRVVDGDGDGACHCDRGSVEARSTPTSPRRMESLPD